MKKLVVLILLVGISSCGFLTDLTKHCNVQPYSYSLDSVNVCLKCDSLTKFLKELKPSDFKTK